MAGGSEFDAEAYLDAVAPALGFTVTAEQRSGVLGFLRVAEGFARAIEAADLPEDTLDLAPVFRPGDTAPGATGEGA